MLLHYTVCNNAIMLGAYCNIMKGTIMYVYKLLYVCKRPPRLVYTLICVLLSSRKLYSIGFIRTPVTEMSDSLRMINILRYRTYFEDTDNMIVFVFIIVTLLVTVPVAVYVFTQYIMKGGPLCKNPCRTRYSIVFYQLF